MRRTSRWARTDPHVDEAGHGGGGIVGVQGGEYQVAGEARLHGDLGGLGVADLADHDDVRVLAQDGAQAAGEGQLDFRVNLYLADPLDLVLDGVLDGDDVLLRRVEPVQGGVEGGGLAAAGGAGDEDDAAGTGQEPLHGREPRIRQPHVREVDDPLLLVQQAQDGPFAEEGGDD
jgi:hypothetical protein